MFFRLLVALSLFGSSVAVQLRGESAADSPPPIYLYRLIAVVFIFSALYAIAIQRMKNLTLLAYIQFFFDGLFISPLIYLTGGVQSIFSFLYFLIIISASYLLFSPGAFFAATISGIFYALMVVAQANRAIPYLPVIPLSDDAGTVFYNITINVFAFYLVAFLSSYLADQFRQTTEALLEEQLNLRELEELYIKIVENIKVGIMTLDTKSKITFLNRAAHDIVGHKPEEVIGQSIDQIFPATSDYLKDIPLNDSAVLKPSRWDRHFTRHDRQRLYLGFSTSPLKNTDGAEVGNILIFEDLTRIRHLEEKTRRDDRLKAIGQLAAGIAHEIRNPLASISGSIQVLRDELDPKDDNRALMDIVIRETDRLNGLITDFLVYVRQAPLAKEQLKLEQLVNDVVRTLRHHPKYPPATTITLNFAHTYTLHADPSQLRQVIWNLVLNAVEVMPEGGSLEVGTRDIPAFGEELISRIELTIADSGPGIQPAVRDRIFDPFFSTKPGGTGFGLAVVDKIIQAHDGLIRVRSRAGGGTVFEIVIPANARGSSGRQGSDRKYRRTDDGQ